MSRFKTLLKQLQWKIILIRILVNGIVLTVVVSILPQIYFLKPTIATILIISIGMGILNALVKPLILLLTGQFIFATFGLLVVLVNTSILYLLEWLFPSWLAIDNFWWAILASVLISLLSNALENLLGLTPPILLEEQTDIRKRIEAEQQVSLVNLVTKPQPAVKHDGDTQSVSEVAAARAVLDSLQGATSHEAANSEDIDSPPGSREPPNLPRMEPKKDESESGDAVGNSSHPGEGGAA